MGILLWIVFGALVGWLASVVMNRNAEQGLLGDIILGIIGALVGGFLASLFGAAPVDGFNLYSMIVALIGAVVVVWVGRLLA